MIEFIIRLLGNSLSLYIAFLLVPGFIINGGIKEYLIAGIILGILNLVVKPIFKMLSMPLIILTLGLFMFVINALLIWFLSYLFSFIIISNLIALVIATIIITVTNLIISGLTKLI